MAATAIRSSSQLYIDADLNHNSKKVTSLATGTADTDGVNVGQMNTAIANAGVGVGSSIHAPVADLAEGKAVVAVERTDKMIMLIETLGLYRYDSESTVASNDDTVIRSTDIASDATAGRWIKMSSTITDHNNLSGKQGGTTGEYYHLTNTQVSALHAQETAATIGALINGSGAATPNNTDFVATALSGGSLQKITWTNVKAFLKTYFDTIYNNYAHPNHSGDVTSVADGVQTIAANAVTNAKAAQMATLTIKGNNTGSTANAIDLTISQVKTMLNIGSQSAAVRTYRATPSGTINGSNAVFTVGALVLSGTEELYKNGILMNAGAGNDYTITYAATTTITFATAPSNTPFTDVILISYSV